MENLQNALESATETVVIHKANGKQQPLNLPASAVTRFIVFDGIRYERVKEGSREYHPADEQVANGS